MTVEDLYERQRKKKNDIYEHLPTLRKYSSLVDHVTEFGVRFGVSTVALLSGRPKTLKSYDINGRSFKNYNKYKNIAKETNFIFTIADVLKIEIEKTDLLFIDTWHTYNQLKKELNLHASKVKRYIIFHDTKTFGSIGQDKKSPGLILAIEEFLKGNKSWHIKKIFKNNNGLYIISKT